MAATMLRAVAVLALFLSLSDAAVNYCGATMCEKSDAHTFCQFTEGPGPTCSGYVDDRLSADEKMRVVARMNRRRSEAAQGKMEQLPAASNMLKLRWVEELAREAQLWADQCHPPGYPEQHDACRDLFAITVGQCVASVVGEAPGLRPETMVDMWYLQGRQYQGAVPVYTADTKKSPMDFAQMMWAHTYLVGCARSRFMTELDGRLRTVIRLVCNFAPRGPAGALWAPGAPATDCPPRARPDPELPSLCAFHHDEVFTFDVTNATVLQEQSVLDTILEIERNDSLEYHGSLDQIFLRKMMIANMSYLATNASSATPIQSTEKTDNFEPIFKEDKMALNNIIDENKHIIDDVIAKMVRETSTTRATKNVLSIVGRPKAYNIEELRGLARKDSENGTTRPVETVKEDDNYRDYEFEDILERNEPDYIATFTESNVTTTLASVFETIGIEKATEVLTTPKSATYLMISTESSNSSISKISNVNSTELEDEAAEAATPYVQNDLLKRLLELSEKTEQNPSDPETSRQLQEALERMEEALASPVSTKVRRELRSKENRNDIQDTRNDEERARKSVPQEKTRTQEIREIGTPDSAPIMNILTKYVPFLQSYENMFTRNSAAIKSHNLVLFVLGIFSSSLLF